MKKGLKLLFIYFITLLASLIIGTVVYALYLDVTEFVAGSEGSGFSLLYVEQAFLFISGCAIILICSFICYYRTRHPYGFLQTLFYIILCLLTWAVLFPSLKMMNDHAKTRINYNYEQKDLTKNIFREANNHVYYFLRDFYKEPLTGADTPAIIIDTSEDGIVDYATVTDSADFELYSAASPYREILIKESFESSSLPVLIDFNLIVRRGELALQKGWSFYLGFLTLAFALCSLYGVTNFYNWKLISVVMIIFETAGILIVNTVYYYTRFAVLIFKLTNNKFFIFLNHFVDDPLLCLMNFLTGVVFITLGIVHYAVQKRKAGAK